MTVWLLTRLVQIENRLRGLCMATIAGYVGTFSKLFKREKVKVSHSRSDSGVSGPLYLGHRRRKAEPIPLLISDDYAQYIQVNLKSGKKETTKFTSAKF